MMWREWIKEWFSLEYDHVFISYLPNKDRAEKEFDIEPWDTKALQIQGHLFGGATSYPAAGSYRKINTEGNIDADVMIEKTSQVVSFINEKDFTERSIREITDFLKQFGKETNQETVACVIDGELLYL